MTTTSDNVNTGGPVRSPVPIVHDTVGVKRMKKTKSRRFAPKIKKRPRTVPSQKKKKKEPPMEEMGEKEQDRYSPSLSPSPNDASTPSPPTSPHSTDFHPIPLQSETPDPIHSDASPSSTNEEEKVREGLKRVQFRNITGSVDLGNTLDLKTLHFSLRNSKYEPQKFCGLRLKIEDPAVTLLIFSSGKMVCTGAKTPEKCKKGAKKGAILVRHILKIPIKFRDFGIRNMVATVNTSLRLHLTNFAMDCCMFADFNPETFSGVICKIVEPVKACMLVFSSGKMVVTGITSRKALYAAVYFILPKLMDNTIGWVDEEEEEEKIAKKKRLTGRWTASMRGKRK